MYSEIKIPTIENINYISSGLQEEENIISGLKKVNIFVGANNSGKSKFMRSLVNNEIEYFDINDIQSWDDVKSSLQPIIEWSNPTSILNYNRPKEYYNETYKHLLKKHNTQKDRDNINEKLGQKPSIDSRNDHISNTIINRVNRVTETQFNNVKYKKIYIPMLRGLKNPIKGNKDDLYRTRILTDNFNDNENGFEVFTGLNLYQEFTELLLGKRGDKDKVRDFEKFLSENFFNGDAIDITPNIHDGNDVLCIKIGNDDDREIYNLGDGIGNIIILLFALFKHRDEDCLFFIEEPELSLHPGMERLFLETIIKQEYKNKFPKIEHQIFLTTHSNHLLDTGLDSTLEDAISIYQFSPTEDNDNKEIKNITQNKEILDVLGVRNSSVFLSNCVIWVEGITDRMYIKKFFDIYQKDKDIQFMEDKHFAFAEYGGANIAHFDFTENEGEDNNNQRVQSISFRNFLVCDHDLHKENGTYDTTENGERLKYFSHIMGNNYFDNHITIENLIPYERYKSFFEQGNKKCWKIKEAVGTKAEFDNSTKTTKIGEIIKNTFIELSDTNNSPAYRNNTSIEMTGYQKTNFAKKILNHVEDNNITDLSEEIILLCSKLYNFIQENNT